MHFTSVIAAAVLVFSSASMAGPVAAAAPDTDANALSGLINRFFNPGLSAPLAPEKRQGPDGPPQPQPTDGAATTTPPPPPPNGGGSGDSGTPPQDARKKRQVVVVTDTTVITVDPSEPTGGPPPAPSQG